MLEENIAYIFKLQAVYLLPKDTANIRLRKFGKYFARLQDVASHKTAILKHSQT
jgi:hypothetical protein